MLKTVGCYAVACNHNHHICLSQAPYLFHEKTKRMSRKISNIAKNIKIWENKLFTYETKDACEDISVPVYFIIIVKEYRRQFRRKSPLF